MQTLDATSKDWCGLEWSEWVPLNQTLGQVPDQEFEAGAIEGESYDTAFAPMLSITAMA